MTVTPAGEPFELGPGTLHIGETGTEIDVSCLVNNMRIAATKDQGDTTTMLCGEQRIPRPSYTYAMSGNVLTDIAETSGLFALSQSAAGTELPYTFTPSTEAGTTAAGVLVIDPLDFGADEYGSLMSSDVEWALTDQPTYTIAGTPLATTGRARTHRDTDTDTDTDVA